MQGWMQRRRLPVALASAALVSALSVGCGGASPESPEPAGDVDVRAGDAQVPDTQPHVDTAPPAPFDPLAGPDPGVFDCSNPQAPGQRLSMVPLDCPLDPTCTERMVVAHRGAGGQFARVAPENSLAAIRAALWMGLDGVELDVRHTSDDELVLMHDGDLERTTGVQASVSDLTAAEISAIPLLPVGATGEPYPGDFTCETVPTLAEALALTRGRLFIDLDTKTSRIDLVVAAIAKADLRDEVFVSVGDATRAAEARALDPAIRVQVRPDTSEELAETLAMFLDRGPEIIELPYLAGEALVGEAKATGATVFVNGFEQDALVLTGASGPEAYLDVFGIGADIVQSEFPAAVLHALGRAPVLE